MDKRVIAAGAILSFLAAVLVVAPGIVKRGAVTRCNERMREVVVSVYGEDDAAPPNAEALRGMTERPSVAVQGCIDALAEHDLFDASVRARVAAADAAWLRAQRDVGTGSPTNADTPAGGSDGGVPE